ncbi:MAG: ABC transporter ATP-binding protein [Vulcanimicrobiaceae bacterium]
MAALSASGLRKRYRDARERATALDGVSFTVEDGRSLVVLGPSGAGKSTLLRVLAGLDRADSGVVRIGDADVTALAAHRRRVALVFADDALFPHLSIYENLAFALRRRRPASGEAGARIREIARAFEIDAHLAYRPARLSNGERQRASIARAVLADPRALLLDEPLVHLDPQLRARVREQFAGFRRTFAAPVVYVTHDHAEALNLADRLAILIDGRIVQCEEPQRVYDFPADVRVARFLGSPAMNLLDDGIQTIGIRPEYVRLSRGGGLGGEVVACERAGAERYVRVRTPHGELLARASADGEDLPGCGEQVSVTLPARHVRRFDRVSGEAIP